MSLIDILPIEILDYINDINNYNKLKDLFILSLKEHFIEMIVDIIFVYDYEININDIYNYYYFSLNQIIEKCKKINIFEFKIMNIYEIYSKLFNLYNKLYLNEIVIYIYFNFSNIKDTFNCNIDNYNHILLELINSIIYNKIDKNFRFI